MKRKWTLIVLIQCLLFTLSFGQVIENIRIKASYINKKLSLVLLDLELAHRLTFECDETLLGGFAVTCSFGKVPLAEGLKIILKGTNLDFEILENRAVNIFSEEKVPEEMFIQSKPRRKNFNISGLVKDAESGETLPFANVSVQGTTLGTEANAGGHFTLFGVPSDTIQLVINYLGYQNSTFRLSPKMKMSNLVMTLSARSVDLDEVLVSAQREEQLIQASTGVSRIGFSPEALSTLPSYGEKDVFRSLQLLPGVSGSNESSSGLFVRGGTPDQNLILFDGFTVYHVDHLFGFFSAFNANAIKDIQLHKGGFDAEFGGRLSSVVEMTGKDGNSEEFDMGAGLSLLSYNAYLESPFDGGRGSILIAGRRSFQSKFYSKLFDAFAGTPEDQNTGSERLGRFDQFAQQTVKPNSYFYDLNAKCTYRLGLKDLVSLSFYNGQDNLDNSRNTDSNALGGRLGGGNTDFSFNRNNTDLSNWGNVGTSLKYTRKWSDRVYTKAILSYSNYFSERDQRNETTINREDTTINRNTGNYEFNDLQDFTLKIDNEVKINQHNQLDFGMQSTFNDIKYDFTQDDTLNLISRNNNGSTISGYIQDRMTLADQFILKGGVRSTYYSLTSQNYFEPRASFTYLMTDQIKVKGSYGKYYQFANRIVREDIQQGSRDFWLLSDGDRIPIGSAVHFIAGLSYETNDFLFDVESYHKDLDGLSEYSTRLSSSGRGPNRTLDYEEFFYTGSGVARGIEFLLQKKSGNLNGWLGYTLSQVKYDFDAFGEETFFANQDRSHEFKMVLNYKLGHWDFASTFIYATGRPYTAPTGYYELPLLDGNQESYFEVSSKNALRLPDYHRFDLSATYNFKLGNSKASVGMSLINLYNRSNIWYKEFEVIEGELLVTDISLIDFTPSIFITWDLR